MKTYIAYGQELDKLEDILHKHEIDTHRFKYIDALSIKTKTPYEELQVLCEGYQLRPENTYDTQNKQ